MAKKTSVVNKPADTSATGKPTEEPVSEAAKVDAHSGPVAAPVTPEQTVFEISSIPDRGFWRSGRQWTPEAQRVLRSDFTVDQWAALINEPNLNIKGANYAKG